MDCLFNPAQYTISKTNGWNVQAVAGYDVPMLTFTGGNAATLTMELFFDTYEEGTDVRLHLDKLWKLMAIDDALRSRTTKLGRPPLCMFHWGPNWSFEAAITNLSVRYTLFLEDGTPVRATADVTFTEGKDNQPQRQSNAVASPTAGQRRRIVQEKETLPLIAYREYGDAAQWRPIADANGLDDPNAIRAGQSLIIPPQIGRTVARADRAVRGAQAAVSNFEREAKSLQAGVKSLQSSAKGLQSGLSSLRRLF